MNKQKLFEELLKKKGIAAPKGPSLVRGDEPGPFKLSFAQRRIWFLQQFDLKGAAYNDPTALRLKGPLQIPVLEQVFNEIIRRHQSLRMTFPAREGQPVQVLHPDDRITVSLTLFQEEPGKTVEDQVLEFVNRFSGQAFDLAHDMPIRAALLKITEDDYALAVNIHHIVMDGWSKGIMLQELMILYEAFSRGYSSPLPELPVQYTDYVRWHHEWMQGKMFESQMAYWKEKLTGAPPVLELPLDHPRPAVPSGRGTLQLFSLSKENFQALDALAKQEDVTLFMLLTTVFNILLYRYSGQEDILIGTPIAGRRRIELENLIGLFLNTLVLRTDLSGNPDFQTLLKRVRSTALEAYNHQDMPFEKLVEELNPQRDLSITPLFQVMFQLQNAPMPPARISGLTITPIQLDTGVSQVDLSLTMWEQDDTLRGTFEYNTDLFADATIMQMIGHFKRLLVSVCEEANREISLLPMLSPAESLQVLEQWNCTGAAYPKDSCIYRLFETCAQKYPDKNAVMFEQQEMTYREMNEKAGRLAHYLQRLGVGPEALVGICIDNSLELIMGVMAILKAGGAYIPLDPQYPDERLGAILKDSQPAVLITLTGYLKRFSTNGYRGKIICLDAGPDVDAVAAGSIYNITNGCEPGNAACVIYTSGSTGIPKGILLENRSIVNLLYSFIQSYHAGPADNILPLTSIASASFVGEILPMLISGGTIVLADKVHFLDMNSLTALMSHYEITILSTVPSMIARLNAMGGERWRTGKLRLLLSGGETLSAGDIDQLMDSITIVNGYGLTEATICSTYEILNHLDFSRHPVISVGKPIMNTRIYILNKYMQPQPMGVPGELYIAGDGLSRGYLNNPEMIAERFILPAATRGLHSPLFKTGDLGLWLPGGRIKFLGRIDTQVQVHGHRIELSEIETVFGLHPDIEDVVVIDRRFGPGDHRLVAYMVLKNDVKQTGATWREWLAKRLPEYMIPTAFEIIAAIPLTVNGKVDMNALPIPSGIRPELNVAFEAPQTEIEKKIAAIWKEFLHLEEVGLNDNFFDLGGHSLLLTQVHSRLSEKFDKELTIIDLFRFSTIRSLSGYIGEKKDNEEQALDTYKKLQERASKQRQAFQRRRT